MAPGLSARRWLAPSSPLQKGVQTQDRELLLPRFHTIASSLPKTTAQTRHPAINLAVRLRAFDLQPLCKGSEFPCDHLHHQHFCQGDFGSATPFLASSLRQHWRLRISQRRGGQSRSLLSLALAKNPVNEKSRTLHQAQDFPSSISATEIGSTG